MDEKKIERLVMRRTKALLKGNHEKANAIMERLLKDGIEITNHLFGTSWRRTKAKPNV